VTLAEGTTLSEAKQERRRLLSQGRPTAPAVELPGSLHELAVDYLRAKEPILAPSTIRGTADSYRLRVAPTFAGTDPATITRPRIEAWVGKLLKEGHSPHAIRKAVAALRVVLSFGVQAGVLDRNAAFGVAVPEPPADPDAPPPVERVLDVDELAPLHEACESPREEVIVRLAVETGLRSGEVRGLRWPDVDLAARRLHVRRAVWRRVVKQPKGKRARRVAITHVLAEALATLYAAEVVGRGADASGYVLTGRDGSSVIGADTPRQVVERVQRRAGLTVEKADAQGKPSTRARVTYHELRHTAATMMLTGGKSAVVVARQLGHRDSRVTTQVYEHLLDDGLLDDALAVFESARIAGRIAGRSGAEV
jgi:integrase